MLITREGKKAFYKSKLCPSIQFGEKTEKSFSKVVHRPNPLNLLGCFSPTLAHFLNCVKEIPQQSRDGKKAIIENMISPAELKFVATVATDGRVKCLPAV